MSGDLPPDFETQWDMSDVILNTENSNGRELHANKSILALFSPYFRALFFRGFKEKNNTVVSVISEFDTMKEILKVTHQMDCNVSVQRVKEYRTKMLVDLYRAADMYDFPTLRKLCLDQMNERPSVQMAKVAMDLDLHDVLMNTIEKLDSNQVKDFTNLENVNHMFSKKDIRLIFKKITGRPLSKPGIPYTNRFPSFLISLAYVIKNPQFDLTKPWEKSNVAIVTKSSILYGNLSSIDVVSRKFRTKVVPMSQALLNEKKWFVNTDKRIKYVAQFDVEYATMLEIISAIHHVHYSTERTLNPLLLYDMHRAADVEHLDIPMIRKMCVDMLREHNTVDAWEVMCRLFGVDLESPMYKSLTPKERRQWICRQNNYLSYTSYSGVVVITPAQTDPFCNLRMLKIIISDVLEW